MIRNHAHRKESAHTFFFIMGAVTKRVRETDCEICDGLAPVRIRPAPIKSNQKWITMTKTPTNPEARKKILDSRAALKAKGDALKLKLKSESPRRYLADFHQDELGAIEVSYFHFCNIMKGRYDQERKDIVDIVDAYLEG